jgi:outer membrane protein OmpA-like peptidoglycan-associated protein
MLSRSVPHLRPNQIVATQREGIMKRNILAVILLGPSVALLLAGGAAAAQTSKVDGLITGRRAASMTLQTSSQPQLVVVLTDATQVAQIQGVFKARRKQMSMTALIPGLQVQVEGTYNAQNELVASSVKFKGNDLEDAQTIQAGMQPAKEQIQQSQEELQQQKAALERQQQAMQEQEQKMAEAQATIDANKAAIEAANKRFGQLDDYNIMDEVTVYFANGKVALDPKYEPQLLQLAEKARTITAFTIQVKGYASSVGSVSLNQQLSEDRANSVTQFLQQQGHIPLTNILAPGAMGESRQVGNDKTAEGQAQNRRVVVRVLQNKGIAGT